MTTPSIVNTELWPHQRQMTDFALSQLDSRGYAWWVAGCAVGKTLTAYNTIIETRAMKTLVLTKKTIINQAWGGNAERFVAGLDVHTYTRGSALQKAAEMLTHQNTKTPYVAVMNYETAALIDKQLKAMRFDLVISDESHKLKSHNSKQSKRLALALNDVPYHIAMTGTPFDDQPTDTYGQVRWMAGAYRAGNSVASKLLSTWTNFFEEYVVYRQIDNIKIPISYKNQGQLRGIIDPFTLYLKSEDVLTLPPELDIDWEVAWTPDLKRVYTDMKTEMLTEWNGQIMVADNVLTQALRLHQLTGGYFTASEGTGHFVTTPKIDATLDILDEIGGLPTVIFTVFETDVQALKPALERKGLSVKLLVGGTYEHEEFQAGDGDVIIVNLAAGNAGIELTRARYAIYYSIGTSKTNYEQSRWRIRRPSSDLNHPVTYYTLMLPGSIDYELRQAMKKKGRFSDNILEGLGNRVE